MAYTFEPTTLPTMMKVEDAPRSPTSVVVDGYPAPSMMLKHVESPIQREVHNPASTVARQDFSLSLARGDDFISDETLADEWAFIVPVPVIVLVPVVVLGVTKLFDMSFLNEPATLSNEVAGNLSLVSTTPCLTRNATLSPSSSTNPLWQGAFCFVAGMELLMLASSSCSKYLLE